MIRGRPSSLVGLAAAVAILATSCQLPDLKQEEQNVAPLAQTSLMYDSKGNLITALHAGQNRTVVPLKRVAKVLQKAVIAIEDERFYQHSGVDLRAIIRAAYQNASAGEIVSGGSTITEQLVKITITGGAVTLARKLREAALAYQLEKKYSKRKILQKYLNTVYFGQGAYGIEAAAQTYFSRSAEDLRLGQAALLAGLIAAPGTFDPTLDPKAARTRRDHVLGRMRSLGMISEKKYRLARAQKLRLVLAEDDKPYPAAYFVEYVKRWFLSNPRFGATKNERYKRLFEGGLRIHTTVDLRMQRYAENAVKAVLPYRTDPHGALTALDPRTGAIKAMVGGRDFFGDSRIAKLNLATGGSTGRPAGSSFKPFALVAALENGITPTDTYKASPEMTINDPRCMTNFEPWVVKNYEGSGYGKISVDQATVSSVNVVYAQITMDVGPERVAETARRMGIRSKLAPICSISLGANPVNTLEMASAYGTLATLGSHVPPTAVTEITDARGRVVYRAQPRPRVVVHPGVAWTAEQILEKVVQYGTGVGANIGRPQAGKTGTGQQWRDAWFSGFIPQLVTTVWVGYPQGQIEMDDTRIGNVTGGSWPAQIWRTFMEKATATMPVLEFEQPEVTYVTVEVDPNRLCVPNDFTPSAAIESAEYIEGAEPRRQCRDSEDAIAVPLVIGMTQGEAQRVLSAYGFSIDVLQDESEAEAGTVLAQTPGEGKRLAPGDDVELVVAS